MKPTAALIPTSLPPWEGHHTSRSSKPGKPQCPPSQHRPVAPSSKRPPSRPLVIQVGDERHSFSTAFTAGRQGNLPITDEFASSHHARFQVAHGGRDVG